MRKKQRTFHLRGRAVKLREQKNEEVQDKAQNKEMVDVKKYRISK